MFPEPVGCTWHLQEVLPLVKEVPKCTDRPSLRANDASGTSVHGSLEG